MVALLIDGLRHGARNRSGAVGSGSAGDRLEGGTG
jgi:hypothetical protein